jgi:hypothetical protein
VSEIALNPPIDDSYVVPGTRLVAGEYPGSRPGTPVSESNARLARFLDVGITAFIDLTDPRDGLQPYDESLKALAAERGIDLFYEQLTIRDMDVCDANGDKIGSVADIYRHEFVHADAAERELLACQDELQGDEDIDAAAQWSRLLSQCGKR